MTWKKRDALLAQTEAHQNLVNDTARMIWEHVEQATRPYVSWSTGKDSTVLLHLCVEMGLDVEAVYFDADAKLPGTETYVEEMQDQYGFAYREIQVEPILETFDRVGGPLADGVEGATMRSTVWAPVQALASEGYDVGLVGLRAEESTSREKRLRDHGQGADHVDGQRTLYPLAWWRTEDVWAYLASREVPVHPAYDRTEYVDRDEIRTSYWCGESGVSVGRWYWLKQEYPGLFNRFAERFPEVRDRC